MLSHPHPGPLELRPDLLAEKHHAHGLDAGLIDFGRKGAQS
jgi:hypothetical protein